MLGGACCGRELRRECQGKKLGWLGGKDSNLDKQIQSLLSYHWTTPHQK